MFKIFRVISLPLSTLQIVDNLRLAAVVDCFYYGQNILLGIITMMSDGMAMMTTYVKHNELLKS